VERLPISGSGDSRGSNLIEGRAGDVGGDGRGGTDEYFRDFRGGALLLRDLLGGRAGDEDSAPD
jgi:hypothetical protein